MKCVAPGDLGIITSNLAESAITLMCSGLPIMMLVALSFNLTSSDLSGVSRIVGCVASPMSCASAVFVCVTGGSISTTFSSAWDGDDIASNVRARGMYNFMFIFCICII